MTALDIASLFLIMLALAFVPSASVALVVARSATHGVLHGVAVACGIVLGDLLFIALAIAGLSVIAETVGWLFVIIRYAGAAYLVWLGYALLTAAPGDGVGADKIRQHGSLAASFVAGLLLTLGDIKAILFYLSLFPTLADPASLSAGDILAILAVTIVTVGGAKLFYAVAATGIVSRSQGPGFASGISKLAGSLLLAAGGYLAIKT